MSEFYNFGCALLISKAPENSNPVPQSLDKNTFAPEKWRKFAQLSRRNCFKLPETAFRVAGDASAAGRCSRRTGGTFSSRPTPRRDQTSCLGRWPGLVSSNWTLSVFFNFFDNKNDFLHLLSS